MDAKTSGEFRFAFGCFVFSALMLLCSVGTWDVTTEMGLVRRGLVSIVSVSLICFACFEAIRWARTRHEGTVLTDAKPAPIRPTRPISSLTPASGTHPSAARHPAALSKRMPPSARPYVFAETVQFVGNEQQVEIRYHNSGGTPAINLGLSSRYAIAGSSFDLDKIKPEDLSVPSGYGDVSAGDWIANRVDSHKTDHPTEFAAMKEGKLRGYVFGYLKYTDVDGISYEPRFCFIWVPQDNAFERCPSNAFVKGQKLR